MKYTLEQLNSKYSDSFWIQKYVKILAIEEQRSDLISRANEMSHILEKEEKINSLFQNRNNNQQRQLSRQDVIKVQFRQPSKIKSPQPGAIPQFSIDPFLVTGDLEASGTVSALPLLFHYPIGSFTGNGQLEGDPILEFLATVIAAGGCIGSGSLQGSTWKEFIRTGDFSGAGQLDGNMWHELPISGQFDGEGQLGGNTWLEYLSTGDTSGAGSLESGNAWLDYLTTGEFDGNGALSADNVRLEHVPFGSFIGSGMLQGNMEMAGPFFVDNVTDQQTSPSGSWDIDITALDYIDGDVLVGLVHVSSTGSAPTIPTTPAGWTRPSAATHSNRITLIYIKAASGTETFTLSDFNDSWLGAVAVVTSVRNASVGSFEVSSANTLDPPSRTYSGGEGNHYWLAMAVGDTENVLTAPTDYIDMAQATLNDGDLGLRAAVSNRHLFAATENPATYGGTAGTINRASTAVLAAGGGSTLITSGSFIGAGNLEGSVWHELFAFATASGNGILEGGNTWLDYLRTGDTTGNGALEGGNTWLDNLRTGDTTGNGALQGGNTWLDHLPMGNFAGSGLIAGSGALEETLTSDDVIESYSPDIWLDASLTGTLWIDTARTLNCTGSGDTVQAWDDISGNDRHMTGSFFFGTPNSTLDYISDGLNGSGSVRAIDESQDTMYTIDSWLHGTTSGSTILYVANPTMDGNTKVLSSQLSASSPRYLVALDAGTGNGPGFLDADGHKSFGGLDTLSGEGIYSVVYDSSTLTASFYVTGTLYGTSSFKAFQWTEEHRLFPQGGATCDLSEYVFIPQALTEAQIIEISDLLATKWGFSEPWTPADIGASLFAWWDPSDPTTVTVDGANITQIDDKSGNSRHLVDVGTGGTIGAINGLDAVQSADSTLNYLSYASSSVTVTDMMSVHSGSDTQWCLASHNNANYFGFTQSGSAAGVHGNAGTPTYRGDGEAISGSTRADLYTAWNGAHIAHASGADLNTSEWTTFKPYWYGFAGATYSGEWGEVILLTSAPDTTLRQKIEGYLAHKWGMEDNLDAGHPYKAAPPTKPY